MRLRVLISAPYFQPVLSRFRSVFDTHDIEVVVPPVTERLEEEDLLKCVTDIDGVICGDDRFTDRVLAAAPRLRVISKWGTGIDSIDQVACRQRGVAVRNTPDAFSGPVADSVLGYILCFARDLPWMDHRMKEGEWSKIAALSMAEGTLGVVGVGRVGKSVVRRAVSFGMRVLGHDLVEMPPDFMTETGIVMTSKEQLLRDADFVTLNCDLNATSFHLMDETSFHRVKPTAVLINTARGGLVDEAALIRALETGRLAGAALDVFEVEPLPIDSPLRRMDNVMLAPHNANSSPRSWERVHWNTIRNLFLELGLPVAGIESP